MSKIRFSDHLRATSGGEAVSHNRPLFTLEQAASNSQNHPVLRQVTATAKRFQLSFISNPDQMIDSVTLDRELGASRASTIDRLQLKHNLASLGVLR
jgi:hypothetical protein